jgi:hypothetical protein
MCCHSGYRKESGSSRSMMQLRFWKSSIIEYVYGLELAVTKITDSLFPSVFKIYHTDIMEHAKNF